MDEELKPITSTVIRLEAVVQMDGTLVPVGAGAEWFRREYAGKTVEFSIEILRVQNG